MNAAQDERIAELEAVVRQLCGATAEAFLLSDPNDPKNPLQVAALRKVYAEARRLGVHP